MQVGTNWVNQWLDPNNPLILSVGVLYCQSILFYFLHTRTEELYIYRYIEARQLSAMAQLQYCLLMMPHLIFPLLVCLCYLAGARGDLARPLPSRAGAGLHLQQSRRTAHG
jgi:hypothetical protein